MEPKAKPEPDSVSLFLDSKQDINDIRHDVENLLKADLNLSHKQDMMVQKLDHLTNRINEGVSKTAWSTHNEVGQIKTILIEMQGKNELRDDRILTNYRNYNRLNWAFWISFIGIFGGIVSIAVGLATIVARMNP